MRTIVKIVSIKEWVKDGKKHTQTTALLDNQEEARGYGKFEVGQKVEAFFNDQWDYYQMKSSSSGGEALPIPNH